MTMREDQAAEVRGNYEVFQTSLPSLLATHRGRYVVYRHRELIDVFDSFKEAFNYCASAFSDEMFSIQEVTAEPLCLGWLPDVAEDGSIRPGSWSAH